MIWSLVHGLASLQLDSQVKLEDGPMGMPGFEAILPPLELRTIS